MLQAPKLGRDWPRRSAATPRSDCTKPGTCFSSSANVATGSLRRPLRSPNRATPRPTMASGRSHSWRGTPGLGSASPAREGGRLGGLRRHVLGPKPSRKAGSRRTKPAKINDHEWRYRHKTSDKQICRVCRYRLRVHAREGSLKRGCICC
jgi:hypothetical protein